MKRLWIGLATVLALALILAGCANSTALRFTNASDCGPAAVSLTNTRSGSISDVTVEPGKSVSVEVEPDVTYHYVVNYQRLPGGLQCEEKRVTTQLSKGKTLNVSLESTLDPALQTPDADAAASPTPP
jgi:hypothetical protein